MSAGPSIRLTIERIDYAGAVRRAIYNDYAQVPKNMSLERCIRFMLQKAGDHFLDKPDERKRD